MREMFKDVDKSIFGGAASIYALLFLFIIIWPSQAEVAITGTLDFTVKRFGWFYLVSFSGVILVLAYLALGRFGSYKLGNPDDRPEYSFASWIGMLFGAGLGVGLVFWGVYEPLIHYIKPPFGEPKTAEAAQIAMRSMYFHWGLHPWAIYTATGLALAYFRYRHGMDGRISTSLTRILGEKRANGSVGKMIDMISVVAILAGVGTAIGFAASQFSTGLNSQFGIPNNNLTLVIITSIICALATISAMKGVAKGIKIVSDANMLIISTMLLLAFIFGPTQYLINIFFEALGIYLNQLPSLSLFLDAGGQVAERTGGDWVGMWSIKNFAWWTAFAPFVGVFLADISKGRTIREFVLACAIVPSILCFMWFTCFGGTAIGLIHTGAFSEQVTEAMLAVPQDSLFVFLRQFPLSQVTIVVAMCLVLTLVITSVNSATFAMGTMVSTTKNEPGVGIRGFWGIFMSVNAFLFIWIGGVFTLRSSSLVAALPFMVIILLMLTSMYKSLRDEEAAQNEV